MRIVALALLLATATPALAQSVYLSVRDWPVERFYSDVSKMARWDLLQPVIDTFEVSEVEFHSCLTVVADDQQLKHRVLHEAVDECIAYAKDRAR